MVKELSFVGIRGFKDKNSMPPKSRSLPILAFLTLIATLCGANAGTLVHFTTDLGEFEVELYDETMPGTVANFLGYVNSGRYDSTIIHRSTTYNPAGIQIIQGGGFELSDNQLITVTADAPIAFESSSANLRGTIAMARLPDPDSATSQWFFNVTDNPGLDFAYAVFGNIVGTSGLAVLDSLAAVPVYDVSEALGPVFAELPLEAPSLNAENLVVVNSVSVVPEPSTAMLLLPAAFGLLRRGRRG